MEIFFDFLYKSVFKKLVGKKGKILLPKQEIPYIINDVGKSLE